MCALQDQAPRTEAKGGPHKRKTSANGAGGGVGGILYLKARLMGHFRVGGILYLKARLMGHFRVGGILYLKTLDIVAQGPSHGNQRA